MTQKDITYQDKLNELHLDLSHPNSRGLVFVLLEGETDIKLYRKLFNLNNCKVERIPGGNPKVEECVCKLLEKHELVIGIRDSDFIGLMDTSYDKLNIFLTDFHDIEMTIISEDECFSSVVSEFTDLKIESHPSLRDDMIQTIEQVSLLKWLNEIENLEIVFKEVSFQDLVSFEGLIINFNEYFNRLLSKSPNAKTLNKESIISKVKVLKSRNPHKFHLCNGHDFIKIFSKYLRDYGKVKGLGDEMVSSILRIKYKKEDFLKTSLYVKIKQWSEYKNCDILVDN